MVEAANPVLVRARGGDADAFRELIDPYRGELQVHCYRILGSLHDAEDMLQETLLAAWRGLARFEGRASVRAWLYRIATNRCLNVLRSRERRPESGPSAQLPAPTAMAEPIWLEPYPDVLLETLPDHAPGPDARYETKEAVALAFIAGLQHLPPTQRAVLVLRDVLGFSVATTAELLGASPGSVKGALQRGRATLRSLIPPDGREQSLRQSSGLESRLLGRFADAIESGDVDAVIDLLTDDARLTMPPQPHEYHGHAAIAAFLRYRASLLGEPLRVVATRANMQPAFACYFRIPHTRIARAYGMLVLALRDGRITAITWLGDASVFPHFGLPRQLQA